MLRVVSYNVCGLRGDRAALVEVIRELAPDVLVLQEAPRRLRWRTRNAQLAHDTDLVYVTGGAWSLGNVIMTTLAVRPDRSWDLRYPLTPGRYMRGAAFARCTTNGVSVVVVGSQLAADPAERPGQAHLLKKALADLDAPVILAADLNEHSTGKAFQAVADGLVGPAQESTSAILVDPRIIVTSARIADSSAARRASDHLPIVVDLKLPG
jgi:endonuclease/exonuclease/phosphatase family metal-dependent hydrolase